MTGRSLNPCPAAGLPPIQHIFRLAKANRNFFASNFLQVLPDTFGLMRKLLLIEDEAALSQNIVAFLAREDLRCEVAFTCHEAIDKLAVYEYDLILLDITLPDGSGLDILRSVRDRLTNTGVLILSAKDSLDDKLAGFSFGADDYLTKPFHLPELNARIKAFFRRKQQQGREVIACGPLQLWPDSREVSVQEQPLDLTAKEYELLLYMLTNQNRVLTKHAIAEHLWGDYRGDADDFDFVYQHIKNLRKKLSQAHSPAFIENVYGLGYKFNSRAE